MATAQQSAEELVQAAMMSGLHTTWRNELLAHLGSPQRTAFLEAYFQTLHHEVMALALADEDLERAAPTFARATAPLPTAEFALAFDDLRERLSQGQTTWTIPDRSALLPAVIARLVQAVAEVPGVPAGYVDLARQQLDGSAPIRSTSLLPRRRIR